MADELPFSKISIPGTTLSSLLHHSLSSTSSSLSGLLFGHLTALPSADPTDSDPSPSSSPSLTITSFLSSPPPFPFFDSLGRTNPNSPFLPPQNPDPNPNPPVLVGWFSSRPFSHLRPTMRDLSVSHHLSKTLTTSKPLLFLLVSFSETLDHAVHTHDYRAYLLLPSRSALTPVSIEVINVGPKFRGQYGSFLPEASLGLPLLPCRARVEGSGNAVVVVENGEEERMGEWSSVPGFGLERLEGLVGERPVAYAKEVEELYQKMMEKMESLVRMVEESSAKVQQQEAHNSLLRSKIAGSE